MGTENTREHLLPLWQDRGELGPCQRQQITITEWSGWKDHSEPQVQTPWWNIWNISQPLWTICRCSITVQMELPGHQLPPVPFVLLLSINETEPGSILSARFFRCLYTSMRSPLEAEQPQLPQPFLVRDAAVPSPPRLNSSRSLSPPQRSLRPAAGAPHLPCP